MATWNTPTDVSTGTALTATLWNNLLGTNGSLKYVYDNLPTAATKNNVVLYKSTNTVIGAGGAAVDIAFDTVITNYADQQLNFPITTPVTDIPLPEAGMYIATFQQRGSVATTVRANFTVDDGTDSYFYVSSLSTQISVLYTHTVMFYAPSSSTVKLSIITAAQTISAVAPSSTDGSQILTITRI